MNEGSVARRQCDIEVRKGTAWILDYGSIPGERFGGSVSVNDRPVTSTEVKQYDELTWHPLRCGDELRVGHAVFRLERDPLDPAFADSVRRSPNRGFQLERLDPLDPPERLCRQRVMGAITPADTADLRLMQMHDICREFTPYISLSDGKLELRQLPCPVHRYQPQDGPVVDGALFGYVCRNGTDLEFVLLMECRETDQGPAWFWAPIPFTTRELRLTHLGQEVWRIGDELD